MQSECEMRADVVVFAKVDAQRHREKEIDPGAGCAGVDGISIPGCYYMVSKLTTPYDLRPYDPAWGTISLGAGSGVTRVGSGSGMAGGSARCLIFRFRCGLNAVPAGIR